MAWSRSGSPTSSAVARPAGPRREWPDPAVRWCTHVDKWRDSEPGGPPGLTAQRHEANLQARPRAWRSSSLTRCAWLALAAARNVLFAQGRDDPLMTRPLW